MMQLGLNLGILAPDTLRCPSGKVSVCQGRDAGDMGSVPWREDPLEEDMASHPVFVPEKSHGQRSLEGYSPLQSQRVRRLSD